jgi:hypothetical protein
MLLRRSKWC